MEQTSGQQRGDRETSQKKPDTLEALITTIITEIQTTTKRSEETIRGGKRLIEIETSTLLHWQETLNTARNASKRVPNNDIITKVLANTEDIKKQLNRPQPSVNTWSQVAATIPTFRHDPKPA
jgi:ribosomal protein L17